MQLRTLVIAVLGACGAVDATSSSPVPLKSADYYTLDMQKADVATRDAERAAAYVKDLRAQTAPADWIAHAYHHRVVDANFDPVVLDDQTIDVIQQSIYDRLYPKFGQIASEKYGDIAELFAAKGLNPRERAEARQAALDGLISVADQAQVDSLGWRIDTVRGGVAGWSWQYQISPAVLAWILSHPIPVWTPPPGQQYVDDCRAQGVPIPPDWPDDQWYHQGALAFTFILAGLDTNVYTYTDPTQPDGAGICYALPRYGTDATLVGIICQNNRNGKACFWDNVTRDTNRELSQSEFPLRIGYIGDGYTLSERCTNCHRGDNVFNIHPGTALDVGSDWTRALVRFSPIGRPGFANPPAIALPAVPPDQRTCNGCHSLPMVSSSYCASVLEPAARFTMPQGWMSEPTATRHAAGWPPAPVRPDYSAHISSLKTACDGAL